MRKIKTSIGELDVWESKDFVWIEPVIVAGQKSYKGIKHESNKSKTGFNEVNKVYWPWEINS